nr:histone-lysine N-methyltransferase EZA1 [Tanacetum cinerariifolium]
MQNLPFSHSEKPRKDEESLRQELELQVKIDKTALIELSIESPIGTGEEAFTIIKTENEEMVNEDVTVPTHFRVYFEVGCGGGALGEPERKGEGQCGNMRLLQKQRKRVLMGRSDVAGWGIFLQRDADKDDLIGEYIGELISDEEADAYKCKVVAYLSSYAQLDKLLSPKEIDFCGGGALGEPERKGEAHWWSHYKTKSGVSISERWSLGCCNFIFTDDFVPGINCGA